jgi:hypothetical protein
MLRLYTSFVFILTSTSLLGQNLVPNPSFECGVGICGYTTYAPDFGTYACEWSCPSGGTSDVFSTLISDKTCYSAIPGIGPESVASQLPRTGTRYAGIYTYSGSTDGPNSYREYLQVKLTTPLIPGEFYCAEMYVYCTPKYNFSCNNLGMYFSGDLVFVDGKLNTLTYSPQIIEKNVINDTVHWVKVSGVFKATSPIKYLLIGNFSMDTETIAIVNNTAPGHTKYAYYFVDDVSVEHFVLPNYAPMGKTKICEGESTTLKVTPGFSDVTWTTLADTLTILSKKDSLTLTPQITTQYRVEVRNCNLSLKDTITVTVDTFLKVNLGKDTTICEGSSIILNAGALFGSQYSWQDESNNQYLNVNKAGKYSVSVSNPYNNCIGYDEINISVETVPKIELGNDMLICKEYSPLKAGGGYESYQWSTGSTDSIFTPFQPGRYAVTVGNQCGQSIDSINIYSASDIFIPNVLTLNGDKLNEEFKIGVVEDQAQNQNASFLVPGKLVVFNRWGNEIFSDSHYTNGWPPLNSDLEYGVYYFVLTYLNCPSYKGWIHVLR